MKKQVVYLRRIEKEQRSHIEVSVTDGVAKAIFAICYPPQVAGGAFRWEVKVVCWELSKPGELQQYQQLLAACQKEERRLFKTALTEAAHYCAGQKRLEKGRLNRKERRRVAGELPLVPVAEIFRKIISQQKDRF